MLINLILYTTYMSVTTLKDVGVLMTVDVVKCKDGGYAWSTKDLPLVGQADTMEDIPAIVNEMVGDLLKLLMKHFEIKPGDR